MLGALTCAAVGEGGEQEQRQAPGPARPAPPFPPGVRVHLRGARLVRARRKAGRRRSGRLFSRHRRPRREAFGLRSGRLPPLRGQEPPRRPSAGAAAALPAQPAGPARGWRGSGLGLRGEVRLPGCPPRCLFPASFPAPSPDLLPGRRSPKCARPAFLPRETFGSPRPLPFPRVKPTGPSCQSGGAWPIAAREAPSPASAPKAGAAGATKLCLCGRGGRRSPPLPSPPRRRQPRAGLRAAPDPRRSRAPCCPDWPAGTAARCGWPGRRSSRASPGLFAGGVPRPFPPCPAGFSCGRQSFPQPEAPGVL